MDAPGPKVHIASMTTLEIMLPDQLARDAARAGLLVPERLAGLLREKLKAARVDELFAAMDRMAEDDGSTAMSPEEVALEIAAMRAEGRASRR